MVIDELKKTEIGEMASLIEAVFDFQVASYFTEEGINEFKSFIAVDKINIRQKEGSLVLVAKLDGKMAGIIEIKFGSHIALLFTALEFQRRGVANNLIKAAITITKNERPYVHKITVNSSPYAVNIYQKLGFFPLTVEQVKYGVRFTPMAKQI